ncbi:MAG: thiamine pyrophosphate-dependent enzyme, partial [Thaumarchaeota archaeon]|nr:thiamine pyrophosphate-dependent enzyme [Nitrososphaerota archaeon]
IASNLQIAVGFAMAARMKKENIVTVSYFGDGATSSGEFHVALNFAGVFKAPCIFVCENNQYAISTPLKIQTASENIAMKSKAYGIHGEAIDGNDFFAVQAAVSAARERALKGQGPSLLECVTYRYGPHSSSDDWKKYRTREEVEEWKKRDPITLLKDRLLAKSILTKESEKKLFEEVQNEITAATKSTENIPPPPVETLFTDVFADLPKTFKDHPLE